MEEKKSCIWLNFRSIIYDVEFFSDSVCVNKPQGMNISTPVIFSSETTVQYKRHSVYTIYQSKHIKI